MFRTSTSAVADADARMVNLRKTARVSLTKAGLNEERAAVYLVLDHSGSMRPHYAAGHVQTLAEQTLALAVNLDDDGTVPVTYFHSHAEQPLDVRLDNYQGVIAGTHTDVRWGSTNYFDAIQAAVTEHSAAGATVPGLVVFQTDGDPDNQNAAERALIEASGLPLFFAFVGFGQHVDFLRRLDTLTGRAVDNASFFHAAHPDLVTDEQLLDGITGEYATWLAAARSAGIVR